MKKRSVILSLLVIATLIAINFGCKKDKISGLPFSAYDNYSINSSYTIDSNGSFLEIHDMASFDSVFEIASLNGKNKSIEPSDFDQNFVIAVIKNNGYNSYELRIKKIDLDTLDQKVINVDYEYNLIQANISWSQRVCSIAMLANLDHHTIRFYENGILMKELGD